MTRMGLRIFTCVISTEESPSDDWRGDDTGMAYKSPTVDRKSKSLGRDFEMVRESGADRGQPPACSSSTIFGCFRAGAINLIAHPAMASIGGPRRGASAVQPVNTLPRANFMEGAAEHQSGDDPTSPVVTCIGQVRCKQAKGIKTPEKAMEEPDMRHQETRNAKLQRSDVCTPAPASPRPSRWKQFLGLKGIVNPGLPPSSEQEFQIDLNRFSSACSSFARTAPCLTDMKRRPHAGNFLAKSLMMLQLERDDPEEKDEKLETRDRDERDVKISKSLEDFKVGVTNGGVSKTSPEEPLWKRRCGMKPLTLDLKKQSLSAPSSLH